MQFLNSRLRVIDHVAISRDGQLFAAGSQLPAFHFKRDNLGIDVWDLGGSVDPVRQFYPDDHIAGFALNPSGRWLYLATGYRAGVLDETYSRYIAVDLKSGFSTPLELLARNNFILDVHPSGEWLVVFGQPTNGRDNCIVSYLQSVNEPPGEEWRIKKKTPHAFTCHLACEPKGTRIIAQDLEVGVLVSSQHYELLIRDATNGAIEGSVPIPGRTVQKLLFSPDGKWLVLRAGPSLLVWNAHDFRQNPRKITVSQRRHLTGIAFHPSGRYLAVTGNDATVKLYDTTNWELSRTFSWNIGPMCSIAFSPDGTLAAAGSASGKVVVWDVDL